LAQKFDAKQATGDPTTMSISEDYAAGILQKSDRTVDSEMLAGV